MLQNNNEKWQHSKIPNNFLELCYNRQMHMLLHMKSCSNSQTDKTNIIKFVEILEIFKKYNRQTNQKVGEGKICYIILRRKGGIVKIIRILLGICGIVPRNPGPVPRQGHLQQEAVLPRQAGARYSRSCLCSGVHSK